MATQEQLIKMRQELINDLMEVVDNHRIEIGAALTCTDVIGALEWVKLEIYKEAQGDYLLSSTYMDNS